MSLPGNIGLLSRMPTPTSSQYGNVDGPASATDNALARFDGTTGKLIQNGVITEDDYTGTLNGPLNNATTTAVGIGYTNQPANDGVEVVSSSASDTQTCTIIGTTNGTDTTVAEAIVLTGTSPKSTVKTDWGVILAIKLSSAAVGTITVREASADQTITTLAPAATSSGVTTVSTTAAYNRTVSVVADGATTKQLGFGGTNTAGTQIYDSQALTGTTAATSNSSFFTLTEIYRGDLESSRTATVTADGTLTLNAGRVALPITDDTTTNATMYPTWVTAATGNLPINVSSTKLTWNPSTGTLNFASTAQRITGDFTNETVASRLAFQTSTTDGQTQMVVLPNGTSPTSGISFFNNSTPTNAARLLLFCNGTEAIVDSGITGSGSQLPMVLKYGGAERVNINANNASFAVPLDITGAAASATASHLQIGSTTQTTIGANGGASALTANPLGYIKAFLGSTAIIIPYYNA